MSSRAAGGRRGGEVTPVTGRNALSAELREHHAASMSWRATGKKFGISGGMAYRIAMQGYMPKNRRIRATLLPPPWVRLAAEWLREREKV